MKKVSIKLVLLGIWSSFLGLPIMGFEPPAPKPQTEYEEMAELAEQFLQELKQEEERKTEEAVRKIAEEQKRIAEEKAVQEKRKKAEAAQKEKERIEKEEAERKAREERLKGKQEKAPAPQLEPPLSPELVYQARPKSPEEKASQEKRAKKIFITLFESLIQYKPITLDYLSLVTLEELAPILNQFEEDTAQQHQLMEKYSIGISTMNQFIADFKNLLNTAIKKRKISHKGAEPSFKDLILNPEMNLSALTRLSLQMMLNGIDENYHNSTELQRWASELKTDVTPLLRIFNTLRKRLIAARDILDAEIKKDLNKSEGERKEEVAELKKSQEFAAKKVAEEPPAKVQEILKKFPQFFENIPQEYQLDFLMNFEKRFAEGRNIDAVLTDLYKQDAKTILTRRLLALAQALGYDSYYLHGYVYVVVRDSKSNPVVLPKYLDMQAKVAWAQKPEEQKKLQDELAAMGQQLMQTYKIHLMPADTIDQFKILLGMDKAIKNDPELKSQITVFKILINPYRQIDQLNGAEVIFPKVVIYAFGKENTQKILNRMYPHFKDMPGLNVQPRYNARVNDLIWVAQGDGDYKGDRYEAYYERPGRVYYRPDITGKKENYHLVHPETGKEIV